MHLKKCRVCNLIQKILNHFDISDIFNYHRPSDNNSLWWLGAGAGDPVLPGTGELSAFLNTQNFHGNEMKENHGIKAYAIYISLYSWGEKHYFKRNWKNLLIAIRF